MASTPNKCSIASPTRPTGSGSDESGVATTSADTADLGARSGVTTASADTVDSDVRLDNERLCFREPSELEAMWYYASFPSCPRLLGRTSSSTSPGFVLDQPPTRYYPFGRVAELRPLMAAGPVGQHAIHASWETTTCPRVMEAIAPLNWTSIDVLRIGALARPEHERPVVVWVGVASASLPPWSVVQDVLGRVRRVLDSQGLIDVECEMRVSDVSPALGPRLIEPTRGVARKYDNARIVDATQTIATTVGQCIAPRDNPWAKGTLGLYVAPVAPATASSDTAGVHVEDQPIWGLTCRHVLFPEPADAPDDDHDDQDKTIDNTNNPDSPVEVLLPGASVLQHALESIQQGIEDTEQTINDSLNGSEGDTLSELKTLDAQRQTSVYLEAFNMSEQARVVGYVDHAPPLRIKKDPSYTRDWALIALHVDKFPEHYAFRNVVDLEMNDLDTEIGSISRLLKEAGHSGRWVHPTDKMIRLNQVIPLREIQGGLIAHELVACVHDEMCHIVLKRGRSTKITVGVALDLRSVRRTVFKGREDTCYEWAILHADAKLTRRLGKMSIFSHKGDSGAAIFDLAGRVGGLLTSGTGNEVQQILRYDITYATPMAHVLNDIEHELGFPVRIL